MILQKYISHMHFTVICYVLYVIHDLFLSQEPFRSVAYIQNIHSGYRCTGTVLNEFEILTAAHCVQDMKNKAYPIIGTHNIYM